MHQEVLISPDQRRPPPRGSTAQKIWCINAEQTHWTSGLNQAELPASAKRAAELKRLLPVSKCIWRTFMKIESRIVALSRMDCCKRCGGQIACGAFALTRIECCQTFRYQPLHAAWKLYWEVLSQGATHLITDEAQEARTHIIWRPHDKASGDVLKRNDDSQCHCVGKPVLEPELEPPILPVLSTSQHQSAKCVEYLGPQSLQCRFYVALKS